MNNEQHQAYKKQQQQKRRNILLYQLSLCIVLFISWEMLTKYRILDPLLFSRPSEVAQLFVIKMQDGTLLPHVFITFLETTISFLLGTFGGLIFAIVLWSSNLLAKVLDPYLVVLNAMPKVALGPIILVIFGPNVLSVIAMGTLISIIISTIVIFSAFRHVNEEYLKVMRIFQANKAQQFKHVTLPASIPTIISTLKVNVGLAWVGVIVGEYLVSSKGLGYLIISGFQIFNFNIVFLSLCIIVVLATFMYKGVEILERSLLKRYHL